MKNTIFSLGLGLLLFASCQNEEVYYESLSTKTSVGEYVEPNIMWGKMDDEAIEYSFSMAMDIFWHQLHQDVFLIDHPDSVNMIGVLPFDDPSTEVFKNNMFPNYGVKYKIFSTPDSNEYHRWEDEQKAQGRVVVSYFDFREGRYVGVSYTWEEWNRIYGKKND